MRPLLIFAIVALATAACQRTPEQQQADDVRSNAQQQGASIENLSGEEADRLEQQAAILENEAKRSGGLTGQRLKVRADALKKESKIIRKQGDQQAEAIKESADARIKASESR